MKILFIHGLASSGAYKMASTLRILLKGSEVIAPDVPIDPSDALPLLEGICRNEQPDLIVGHSLGGYWAQKLRGYRKLLVNPELHASRFLRGKIGTMEYLSPRRDGALSFEITPGICDAYESLEATEFEGIDATETNLTAAVFADHDEMVDCFDEFNRIYNGRGHRYPGTHLPTFPQVKNYMLPVLEAEFGIQ
jgi:Predicted esterase